MQQVCPHHGDALFDGNAHSVRYGEMIHDGSGKLEKGNSQEGADSETFVIGSDAAEFVNKVKDQVRSRQKNVECCRIRRRAFNNLGNFHGCNDECGDIHGKEFLNFSKFHHEFRRSHFETNVRHHCKIGVRTSRNQQFGQHSLEKQFMETSVTDR